VSRERRLAAHEAGALGARSACQAAQALHEMKAASAQRMRASGESASTIATMLGFGAPVALEDHAVRACRATLEIQDALARLAAQVRDHDGVELALRIGLDSGQVIAGEVGSASLGYTTIGEQVGMAQRMESVAPPGGVMLSASTARLVEGAAVLDGAELIQIKGADDGVPVCRLLGMRQDRTVKRRGEPGWSAMGNERRRGIIGPCHRRPWRCGGHCRVAWYRKKPSGARAFRYSLCAWGGGFRNFLRVAHQPDSLPRCCSALARGHRS